MMSMQPIPLELRSVRGLQEMPALTPPPGRSLLFTGLYWFIAASVLFNFSVAVVALTFSEQTAFTVGGGIDIAAATAASGFTYSMGLLSYFLARQVELCLCGTHAHAACCDAFHICLAAVIVLLQVGFVVIQVDLLARSAHADSGAQVDLALLAVAQIIDTVVSMPICILLLLE